jgi:hypothetical protein
MMAASQYKTRNARINRGGTQHIKHSSHANEKQPDTARVEGVVRRGIDSYQF